MTTSWKKWTKICVRSTGLGGECPVYVCTSPKKCCSARLWPLLSSARLVLVQCKGRSSVSLKVLSLKARKFQKFFVLKTGFRKYKAEPSFFRLVHASSVRSTPIPPTYAFESNSSFSLTSQKSKFVVDLCLSFQLNFCAWNGKTEATVVWCQYCLILVIFLTGYVRSSGQNSSSKCLKTWHSTKKAKCPLGKIGSVLWCL